MMDDIKQLWTLLRIGGKIFYPGERFRTEMGVIWLRNRTSKEINCGHHRSQRGGVWYPRIGIG
jgi:hypothetical protein